MQRICALALACLLLGAIPTGSAASFGAYGERITTSSADYNMQLKDLASFANAKVCARDVGTSSVATDDLYYLAIGSSTVSSVHDVRLTSAAGFTAGTYVASGATDANQPFNGIGPGLTSGCSGATAENDIGFVEMDGLHGYSAGDLVVWSPSATYAAGSVRLSTASAQDPVSVSPGTYVQAGEADLSQGLNGNGRYPDCAGSPAAPSCATIPVLERGNFEFRFHDVNMNGILDASDALLLQYKPTNTVSPLSPSLHDVFIAGATLGSKVTRSHADYLVEPEVACTGGLTVGCMTVAPLLVGTGSATTCSPLYLRFKDAAGTSTVLQVDDVVLYLPTGSCAASQPVSTVAMGTPVTTVAHGQGTAFTSAGAAVNQIYYVDINANTHYDPSDPVYLHRPASLGGDGATPPATGVKVGDLRMSSVVASGTTFAAGTTVGTGDADVTVFASLATNVGAGQTWVVRKIDVDGADEVRLQAMTGMLYNDANGNNFWDPATESIVRDVGATANGCAGTGTTGCVNGGDFIVWKGSDSSVAASMVTPVTCPAAAPDPCAIPQAQLKAMQDVKVTGADATWDAAREEIVVHSWDAVLNEEDHYLVGLNGLVHGSAGTVSCGAGDCKNDGPHTSDLLYLTRGPSGAIPPRLVVGDLPIATSPTRITATGNDFVPSLTVITASTGKGTLSRYDRGVQASAADDAFYLQSTASTTLGGNSLRLVAMPGKSPGSMVASGDVEETASATTQAANFADFIFHRDVDGISGYSLGDAVYVDNPSATGGAGDSALGVNDFRLTSAIIGSNSYAAGSMVVIGHADMTAGTNASGLGNWAIGYLDDNRNGLLDAGDIVYAVPPGTAAVSTGIQPPLGAVRLTGTAPSAPPAPSPSGGGGSPSPSPVATPPSPAATPPAAPPAVPPAAPPSVAPPPSPEEALAIIERANADLAARLVVARDNSDAVLTWPLQEGVSGYQVWRHTSPWVALVTLPAGSTSHRDAGAPTGSVYAVTAFVETANATVGDIVDLNGHVVPGLGAEAAGTVIAGEAGRAPIPGFALVAGVVALLAMAFVRRRR